MTEAIINGSTMVLTHLRGDAAGQVVEAEVKLCEVHEPS